jgi:Na+/melibiose symporter-like transporter
VALLAAFVWYEAHIESPALDVRLFRNPRFSAAVGAVGLTFFAGMGVMFFSAFYLQLVRGYSPLQTGLLFLPFAGAQLIFAPRSAAAVQRFGPKLVCAVGLGLSAVAVSAFLFTTADTPAWVLMAVFFVQGAGMANVVAPTAEAVISALPREKAGVGSAVNNTIRQIGGALGVAVLGSVLSQVYRGEISGQLGVLPAGARDAAAESVAATYTAAERAGAAGSALIGPANDAFITSMHWAAAGATLTAVLGVLAVLRWLPGQSAPHPSVAVEPSFDDALVEVS